MEQIFVDLGAHKGSYSVYVRDNYPDFNIFAFEADPKKAERLSQILGINFVPKAAWLFDGEVDFYRDVKGGSKGSTLMQNKTSGKVDYKHPLLIPCVDFSSWISDHKNANLIVKMNIEGAEFPLLEHMYKEDTLKYIRVLVCAWHENKIGYKDTWIKYAVRDKIPYVLNFKDYRNQFWKALSYA
jgi:FkbM family methyltransferase